MITVILIGPENSGNIGAVCRVMKNFGFSELLIIDPKVKINTITARKRSKHASDILKKAKIKNLSFLSKESFDYLIATTGKLGTDYNIRRSPITPKNLSSHIPSSLTSSKKIGIVFGRESKGLSNKEISLCDFVVSIPTSREYHSMNLSHAVSIILYELSKNSGKEKITDNFIYASAAEKFQIKKNLDHILNSLEFSTTSKKQTQKTVWNKIIGKSFLTKREAFALIGFLKKIYSRLKLR